MKNPSEYRQQYLIRFGQMIREKRIERGLSQDELAQQCGYKSRSSINKIEKGVYDLPLPKVKTLADALGIDPAILIGIDVEQPEDVTEEDIALARQIRRLDAYRRKLVESIINTDPEQ